MYSFVYRVCTWLYIHSKMNLNSFKYYGRGLKSINIEINGHPILLPSVADLVKKTDVIYKKFN